jgi:iron complex outermembrane receptor protein
MGNRSISSAAALSGGVLAATLLGSSVAWPDDTSLVEIVVTANKREENVQNVASSVSVETGEKLIERGQTGLADYAAYMPGFNVSSQGTPGQSSVELRGISTGTSTSAIGTYLDDVPMGATSGWVNAATTLLDMLPYDLERLEVLRGPQGTLYGAGSMGGLIKYVLKAPSTTNLEATVGAETNHIDGTGSAGYAAQARVNIPVIEHALGVSVSVFGRREPGFMQNDFNGERDTNESKMYGARVAALWTPTDTLSVKLQALTQNIEARDAALRQFASSVSVSGSALVVAPTDPLPKYHESIAFGAPYDQRIDLYQATVDWNPGPVSVVSATSYSSQRSYYQVDGSYALGPYLGLFGGPGPGLLAYEGFFGLDKITQELRVLSPQDSTIEWLAGVFVTHENSTNTQGYVPYNLNYTPMTGAIAFPNFFYATLPEQYDEYAGFADITWHVTDAFSLGAGGRYAHNDQNDNWFVQPGPLVNETGDVHLASHEGVFTWMADARYQFSKDLMIYFRVATGYRPGGPNSPIAGIPQTVGADKLINYELGVKSQFLDHKATINAAIYRIDWHDIQLIATKNSLSFFANGGKSVSQGLELQATYSPISALTFGFNAAYTDAHLTSVIPESNYLLTGYQLPNVPKQSYSLTADYTVPITSAWKAHVGGGYRYLSPQWLALVESPGPSSTPTVRAPGYSVFDLNVSLRNDHLTFKAYVRNVANNDAAVNGSVQGLVTTSGATGNQQVLEAFLPPRTIGVGVDYNF